MGGLVMGRGADLIITDDPWKPDEALSEAQRTAVNEWFDQDFLQRRLRGGACSLMRTLLRRRFP